MKDIHELAKELLIANSRLEDAIQRHAAIASELRCAKGNMDNARRSAVEAHEAYRKAQAVRYSIA